MRTRKQIIGLLLLALAATGFACGSDSEDEAPPDSGGFVGRRDGGDDEDEDASSDEETDAGSADAGDDEDTEIASEKEAKAKGWVVGCYKQPKTNDELLNGCATGWRLFDESLYPADWKQGQLPTLP